MWTPSVTSASLKFHHNILFHVLEEVSWNNCMQFPCLLSYLVRYRATELQLSVLCFSDPALKPEPTRTAGCNPPVFSAESAPEMRAPSHAWAWSSLLNPQLLLFWCCARHNAHSKGDFRTSFSWWCIILLFTVKLLEKGNREKKNN